MEVLFESVIMQKHIEQIRVLHFDPFFCFLSSDFSCCFEKSNNEDDNNKDNNNNYNNSNNSNNENNDKSNTSNSSNDNKQPISTR